MNSDVNWMVENVILNKGRIMISADVSVKKKNIAYAKEIMLEIQAYVVTGVTSVAILVNS